MIHFPDTVLHRKCIVETSGGVYGETIQEYVYTDDITCDFQNETSSELAHAYGIELSDMYKIYLDISTSLNASDILYDDEGNTYEVIGSVKEYGKFHKYKKAELRRSRV